MRQETMLRQISFIEDQRLPVADKRAEGDAVIAVVVVVVVVVLEEMLRAESVGEVEVSLDTSSISSPVDSTTAVVAAEGVEDVTEDDDDDDDDDAKGSRDSFFSFFFTFFLPSTMVLI
jgi:hypothetical protein